MPYRALYRQWRPKDFSHVVGQRAVIDTLRKQVVTGRIAHAYLFCGSRGTGKTSTAKILARAINCENPDNGDPCGKCANCQRMENEESLDIIEIDAASNNGVDEMRELRDTVKYPPQFGKYKVYIIDEVHMLSTSAFNALLKTLEEPPAHIVFILATTEPQKLPETILSRCQRFDFGRIAAADIQERLREASEGSGAKVTDGALMVIARAAEGGMRDALSILDMCLGYGDEINEQMVRSILGSCDQEFLFQFADALAEEESGKLFHMIDSVMRGGRDPGVFIKDISYHLRALLVSKCCPENMEDILDLTAEDADEYRKQSEKLTVSRLMQMMDLFMKAENELRLSSSPRLALETVCLKCCIRTTEPDAQALIDRIAVLEKELSEVRSALEGNTAVIRKKASPEQKISEKPSDKKTETAKEIPQASRQNTGNSFQAQWDEIMKRIKKEEPALWGMLSQGKAFKGNDNSIKWMPNNAAGSEFYLKTLNREEKKSRIETCLKDILGEACIFSAVQYSGTEAVQNNNENEFIGQLYDTFGKEPVDIVE